MNTFYVFGDQSTGCLSFLKEVPRDKARQNPSCNAFLEGAVLVIRDESRRCQNSLQFHDIWQLIEQRQSRPQDAALDSALCCIYQLASYISIFEKSPLCAPEAGRVLGLCTGLIAATVAASANSLPELISLSKEAVRVSYRLGHLVGRVAKSIDGSDETWSTILIAKEQTVIAAIEDVQQAKALRISAQAWVSAKSASTVTLSAPPVLKRSLFEESETLRNLSCVAISIPGPYHARHLYQDEDIKSILEPRSIQHAFRQAKILRPLSSSVTGRPIIASDPLDLLKQCIEEILMAPICVDKVICEALNVDKARCQIYQFGSSSLSQALHAALLTKGYDSSLRTATTLQHSSSQSTDIAIVGMSGRFPGAGDLKSFWQLLQDGLDVHSEIPPSRFDTQTHFDASGKSANTSHTPFGCFIEEPGLFDPRFFNMSPREAQQTDPMQRLLLTTAYEAMEMAGIVPGRTPSTQRNRIGTFYGQTSDDWREINASQDIDTYFITGGVRAFGPGRINHHFKFSGPSYSIDTACSSSFAAIQLACTSLRAGECDTALSGGSNIMTNPDIFAGLSRGHFLSKTGSCKTWDNDADGYCRGDAVATVVLKRLDDAIADNDKVLGVIKGIATNHSAEAVSITHPHAGAQSDLFTNILRGSQVEADEVSYVEMHGTGTQAGDSTEMQSVTNVLAPQVNRRCTPLFLGAVKSNIGHAEAASGVSALIKVLLMFRYNSIPPHPGIKGTINQAFPADLLERNVHIPFKKTPFVRPTEGSRVVMLNNFSAAGGNTALVLADGPTREHITPASSRDPRGSYIITVSAKSLASFRRNISQLQSFIDNQEASHIDLPSLSYTTTARRIHYYYRAAIVVQDGEKGSASASLEEMKNAQHRPMSLEPPSIAMVFTGQGSQYTGIGSKLLATSDFFRAQIEHYCNIAVQQGFPSFRPLIDGQTSCDELSPVVVQLGLTCFQMALTRLWAHWGVRPNIVIGHSLGEYAALNAAGVLSDADTIYLVGTRATLLQQYCIIGTHSMLAVKAGKAEIMPLIDGMSVEFACFNGALDTVLSGNVSDINRAHSQLKANGFAATILRLPYAFHSSQVDRILDGFEKAASDVAFLKPRIPIISPLHGCAVDKDGVFSASYLARHCREPVHFYQSLKKAEETLNSRTLCIEVGAHPLCSNMIKSTLSSTILPSARKSEDAWKVITCNVRALYVAGVAIDWDAFHQEYEASLRLVDLPSYAFDEKNFWLDYKNDWCLRKGEPMDCSPAAAVSMPSRLGTSVHRIKSQNICPTYADVVAETDFLDPLLRSIVSGHLVNGVPLCPSSLYADMAYTLGNFTYRLLEPENKSAINVRNMECLKPLLLDQMDAYQQHVVFIQIHLDLLAKTGEVLIGSDVAGHQNIHAKCSVAFEDPEQWTSQWRPISHLVHNSVKSLRANSKQERYDVVGRRVAYKLFARLVQYSHQFQGMEEVAFDAEELEGTSVVKFQSRAEDGDFTISPYCIDSVAHLSGFVLNASSDVGENQVYISHGWESMRFSRPLELSEVYHAYVKMQAQDARTMKGDVYVLNSRYEIIGMVGGLGFKAMPLSTLSAVLTSAKSSSPVKLSIKAPKHVPAYTGDLKADTWQREANKEVRLSKNLTGRQRRLLLSPTPPSPASSMGSLSSPSSIGSLSFSSIGTPITEPDSIATPISTLDANAIFHPTVSQAIDILRSTISEETCISIEELLHCSDLRSLGMDSLMTLTILAKIREKTGLSINPTLLDDNKSLAEVERALVATLPAPVKPRIDTLSSCTSTIAPLSAPSFLLQGNPRTATRNLFLLPDGSGSATSYSHLSSIDNVGLCVWGLNCPFMTSPDAFTIGIPAVAEIYVKEIQRRQPEGPYLLGGWSAGGILAFEAAKLLVSKGNTVERLILIDSPNPVDLAPMPARTFKFLDAIGIFKDRGEGSETVFFKTPAWLVPHFEACVRNLTTYDPKKIDSTCCSNSRNSWAPVLRTTLIWAREGVCRNVGDPQPPPGPQGEDTRSMMWLLKDRTDFTCNGWGKLLGGRENCETFTLDRVNHFNMMKGDGAQRLSALLRKVLLV